MQFRIEARVRKVKLKPAASVQVSTVIGAHSVPDWYEPPTDWLRSDNYRWLRWRTGRTEQVRRQCVRGGAFPGMQRESAGLEGAAGDYL